MNFSLELIPSSALWGGHLLYLLSLGWAIWKAPWYHLKDAQDTHVLLGSWILIWLIWHMKAGITPGMEFHLLLVTTLTLMFGWPFAILGTSFAQFGLTLEGQAQWATFSLNTLCNGIIPISVTYGIYWLVYWWLPRHFFIYIYVTVFAGSALALLASRLIGVGVLLMSGHYDPQQLGEEAWFIVVMLFPEAFINGLLMTVLVVYCPQWVSSFSDQHYLQGK
jgi:uncharacterized membrane protein